MEHSNSKHLMLIVEDSDIDFETTMRAFKKSNMANPIHRCEDGEDALDFLFHRNRYSDESRFPRPDLILLDLNLPGTDGREVLQAVKNEPNLKTIPVIVLTTSSDEVDIESCYKEGANSYINKPVDLEGFFNAMAMLTDFWFKVVILPKP